MNNLLEAQTFFARVRWGFHLGIPRYLGGGGAVLQVLSVCLVGGRGSIKLALRGNHAYGLSASRKILSNKIDG